MSARVCAVVVTFNRMGLLRECLEGLRKQTRPPDAVVVVNNASTDRTDDMVSGEYPEAVLLNLSENTGGAGGFHEGMRWAHQNSFEWIWVMDDDVEPYPDALEVMLSYQHLSKFIHSRRSHNNNIFPWEGVWDIGALQKWSFKRDVSFDNGLDWIAVNYGNFEGALIHRTIVDHVGYPDPRFFVMGDDSVYGFLASFYTNVLYIKHIGLRRKLPFENTVTGNKLYFLFRNRFLTYEHLEGAGVPLSRLSFWFHIFLTLGSVLKTQPEARSLGCLGKVLAGIQDGVRKRYGKPSWL